MHSGPLRNFQVWDAAFAGQAMTSSAVHGELQLTPGSLRFGKAEVLLEAKDLRDTSPVHQLILMSLAAAKVKDGLGSRVVRRPFQTRPSVPAGVEKAATAPRSKLGGAGQ